MEQEKEWWNDEIYWTELNQPDYAKVVAEATRRGEKKAWEEAMEYVYRNLESMADIQEEKMLYDAAEKIYEKMETKLASLTNKKEI